MPLEDEIRDLVGDFYDGKMTAQHFREKFAPMFLESDRFISEIQDVFIDIDSVYAEFIVGRIDEAELRKQLFDLLPSTRLQVPESNSSEVWKFPTAATENNSPRLSSGKSPKTTPQQASILIHA